MKTSSNNIIANTDSFFKKFGDCEQSNIYELDLAKLMISKIKIEFLLKDLFVLNKVILINGRRGSRKTTFMYALLHALTSDDNDFLGFEINRKYKYKVFYFDAENSITDIKKLSFDVNTHIFHVFSNADINNNFTLPRLDKKIKYKIPCFITDIKFKQLVNEHLKRFAKSKNTTIDKLTPKEKENFIKKIEKNYTCKNFKYCTNFYFYLIFLAKLQGYHPILVFDALSYFKGSAKENSDEMKDVMEKFMELRNFGATVFVLQNSGKSETSASRGHSSIEDYVDATFQIIAPDDPIFNNTSEYYHFKCLGKNRGASSDISIYLDFVENDDFIEIINKTNIQKENLEYIILSQLAQHDKISKFELIKKVKKITAKSNQQHKKINDTLSDLVLKKFVRYESVKKDGKGRPTSYYFLTTAGEEELEDMKNLENESFILEKPPIPDDEEEPF